MSLYRKITSLICIYLICTQTLPAHAQFQASYNYYIDQSQQAIDRRDFQSLLFYIESAHLANPEARKPFELIKELPIYQNNIQILKGYLIQAVEALDRGAYQSALFYFELSLVVTPDDTLIKEYIAYVKKLIRGEVVDKKPLVERIKREYSIELPIEANVNEAEHISAGADSKEKEAKTEESGILDVVKTEPKKKTLEGKGGPSFTKDKQKIIFFRSKPSPDDIRDVIIMDQQLWEAQPNTSIELEFNQSLILQGQNISRFLVLDPDYLIIERLDQDRIMITSIRRGPTILHVWDDRGRWTFNIRGVIPVEARKGYKQEKEELWESYVKPFTFRYSNNWGAFYRGDSFDTLSRRSLNFSQVFAIDGPTPYGYFDASANLYRFEESTENTQRTIGLTDAKIGPFEDFSIRGWDTYKRFSDLSLPGRYFRGGKIDAYAFDHRVLYTYLRGQDRATFVTLSGGSQEIRKSFIEAIRLTLFPDTIHQYSFNYGRGWGEERPNNLKDKVFSVDTEHQLGDLNLVAETAYDEDVNATLLKTRYEKENYKVRFNARHIDEEFATLTGRPSGRGITGGNLVYSWDPREGIDFSVNFDLYQNNDIPNPENPDALNYEIGSFVNVPLSETASWSTSAYYSDTPQIISPRRNINLNTTLHKTFKVIFDKSLSTFVGVSHHRNRYKLLPDNEFDRSTLRAGFRYPIFKSLSYYLNYDYHYIDPKDREGINKPHVLSTGLSYNQTFWDKVTMRASVSYRDEEDTEGEFTFLSGTDILRSSLGFSYRPSSNYEIFVDGNYRNVWAESNEQAAFNDADVRFGVRASWDLLFGWNPKATVSGFVFKDVNRNGLKDNDEPGIANTKVRIGNNMVTTNQNGFYSKSVRAKEVKIAIQLDSVPQGHSLTTDPSKNIVIKQGERFSQDFGFIVHTEVYGVIFVDSNGNNKFDPEEKTVPRVKVRLNGSQVSVSDFEGIYSFYDVMPGEHVVTLDVNSVPLEYLPKMKLTQEITVYEGSSISLNIPLKRK